MGFHEVRFPDDISYGSSGGPGYSTFIQSVDSGAEERISRWSQARHQYDVSYGIHNYTELAAVRTFLHARLGAAFGFRFKDYLDSTSTVDGIAPELDGGTTPANDDVEIGVGDGSQTQFQLIKKYTSGPVAKIRTITKPVAGTVLIAVNGVAQVESVDFTFDTTTGIVTFTVAPPLDDSVTAGFQFDVPVRFTSSIDSLLSVNAESFGLGGIDSIPLVEIIDEGERADEFFFGGATNHGVITVNHQLLFSDGRVQTFVPDPGLEIAMPEITDELATGGVYVYIFNDSVNSVDLITFGGTLITTIAAGVTVAVLLSKDSVDVATWHAI